MIRRPFQRADFTFQRRLSLLSRCTGCNGLADEGDARVLITYTRFFKRQLLVVPNIKLGAAWTDRDENDLKANFLFKAGGDGVTIPVRGYAMHPLTLAVAVRPSSAARCLAVFPDGVQPDDPLAEASTVGGNAMVAGGLELRA